MDMYIIPANSNNGKLIFSIFTKFDLIMEVSGLGISIISMLIFAPGSLRGLLMCLIPGLVTTALVVPIPNYHNIFTVFKDLIEFFYQRRNYKWEGWCSSDEFK